MGTLWRKEFGTVAPFLLLVLFFGSMDWGFVLLTRFPDQHPLSDSVNLDEPGIGIFIMFLLALGMGSGLLVREKDEGTLNFLDALPVSRGRVFAAKVILGLGVLWVLPVAGLVAAVIYHGMSRTSLDRDFHWNLLLVTTALEMCASFVHLSLAMALSFLRRMGFLVLGLLFWAFLLMREWRVPHIEWFNIFSLADPGFEGSRVVVPWTQLFVQLAFGGACLGLAHRGFLNLGMESGRPSASRRKLILGWVATSAMVAAWLGIAVFYLMRDDRQSGRESDEKSTFQKWNNERATTASYQFIYPANLSSRAGQLIDVSEGVHAKVRDFLGGKAAGKIAVDMTGATPRHAGQAYWKKIQINLNVSTNLDIMASILGHETAHVYLDLISESRLTDAFNSTRFFHEGLATYLEYALFLPEGRVEEMRRMAAVIRARKQVEFDNFLNDDALTRKVDLDWVYPMGELFVEALIQRYGRDAPGKVIRAFARKDAPKGLKGNELWQDVVQAAGFNLSEVIDRWYAELDRLAERYRRFNDSLPRLRGAVEMREGFIIIRLDGDRPRPGVRLCRFRSAADTPDRNYEWAVLEKDGTFRVPRSQFSGATFWYQVGLRTPGVALPLFEPWIEAPLKK